MPRRKASGPGNGPAKGTGSDRPRMPGFTDEERAKSRRTQADRRLERQKAREAEDRAKAEAASVQEITRIATGAPVPTDDTRDFVRQQIRRWAERKRASDPDFRPLDRQLNAAEIQNAFADMTEPAILAVFGVLTDERTWAKDKLLAASMVFDRVMGGVAQKIINVRDDLGGKTVDELKAELLEHAKTLGVVVDLPASSLEEVPTDG